MVRTFQSERLTIQPGYFILIALALLIIPVRWVVGWFGAVFFHEFCHYIALRAYKVSVFQIKIGIGGVNMQTGEMTVLQEVICALAGPLGSLLLLFLLHVYPYVSLCALAQSLFNLMPIYPMDGGRVITGICVGLIGEKKGILLSNTISGIFLALLFCVSLHLSLHYRLGILPIIISLIIITRVVKIPCKVRQLIVQ